MKRHIKINLATALQITAVLIIFLFGYPRCSTNGKSKEKIVYTLPKTVVSTILSSTLK